VRFGKQLAAGGVFVMGVGVGEVLPDVGQAGCAKKRIDDRVQKNVGVGMSEQSFFVRDFDAAQNQLAPFYQLVDVVSLPYPSGHFYLASKRKIDGYLYHKTATNRQTDTEVLNYLFIRFGP
jgi:hypothetical protein